jgi:hypothetical protein
MCGFTLFTVCVLLFIHRLEVPAFKCVDYHCRWSILDYSTSGLPWIKFTSGLFWSTITSGFTDLRLCSPVPDGT